MCYPVICPSCRKTTWDGCGAHVDSVMASVPASSRCVCQENPAYFGGSEVFGSSLDR